MMDSPPLSDEQVDYYHNVFFIPGLIFLDSGFEKNSPRNEKICLLLQLPLSRLGELNRA